MGGAALYNILLVSHLKNRGYDVCLINGPAGQNEAEMLDYFEGGAPHFRQILIPELEREIRPWNDLVTLIKLVRLLRRERPDIVHTHTSKAGLIGRVASLIAGVPCLIHSVHGTIFKEFFSPWKSKFFILLERLLGQKTDLLLTDTNLIRQELIGLNIAPAHRIQVLTLGLDLEPFKSLGSFKGFLRNLLQLPTQTKLVGTVARLVPIKGIQYLIEAAAQLLPRIPDLHFVIVGDGELKAELMEKAGRLGIEKQVSFLGFWKDLRQIYADLDVLVVPSISEGCPVAVLEGMASVKPIVATAVGGIPDVLTNDQNGLLVPSKNPDFLAEAIHRCLTEDGLGTRLAQKAKEDVFKRFTILQSVEATEQSYRQIFPWTPDPIHEIERL